MSPIRSRDIGPDVRLSDTGHAWKPGDLCYVQVMVIPARTTKPGQMIYEGVVKNVLPAEDEEDRLRWGDFCAGVELGKGQRMLLPLSALCKSWEEAAETNFKLDQMLLTIEKLIAAEETAG